MFGSDDDDFSRTSRRFRFFVVFGARRPLSGPGAVEHRSGLKSRPGWIPGGVRGRILSRCWPGDRRSRFLDEGRPGRTKGVGFGTGGIRKLLHAAGFRPAAVHTPRCMVASSAGGRRGNRLRVADSLILPLLPPPFRPPRLGVNSHLAVQGRRAGSVLPDETAGIWQMESRRLHLLVVVG